MYPIYVHIVIPSHKLHPFRSMSTHCPPPQKKNQFLSFPLTSMLNFNLFHFCLTPRNKFYVVWTVTRNGYKIWLKKNKCRSSQVVFRKKCSCTEYPQHHCMRSKVPHIHQYPLSPIFDLNYTIYILVVSSTPKCHTFSLKVHLFSR